MIKHILLATNGSKSSLSAENHALHLANSLQAKLTVVHVTDDRLAHYGEVDQLMTAVTKEQFVDYVRNNNDTTTRRIVEDFGRKADRLGVDHILAVASGVPERTIVTMAAENAVDLLVIGSGSGTASRFPLSAGIAGKITRNSPCPVFTAK